MPGTHVGKVPMATWALLDATWRAHDRAEREGGGVSGVCACVAVLQAAKPSKLPHGQRLPSRSLRWGPSLETPRHSLLLVRHTYALFAGERWPPERIISRPAAPCQRTGSF